MEKHGVRRLTREESRALTRMRLLASARELMAREGYENVSIDRIADGAGYSKGAFYSNFSSKEEIFLELLELHAKQDVSEIHKLLDDVVEPDDIIARVGDWASERATDPSWGVLALEVFRRARNDETFSDRHANLFREQWVSLGKMMMKLFPEGGAPSDAATLGGIVFELTYGAAASFTNGPSVKDMITTVLKAMLDAYGRKSQPLPVAPVARKRSTA